MTTPTVQYPVQVYKDENIVNDNTGKLDFIGKLNATFDNGYVKVSVSDPTIIFQRSGMQIGTNVKTINVTGTGITANVGGDGTVATILANLPTIILSNIRISKISAYTVDNGDKGKTIALSGGTLSSLVFASAETYDPDFLVIVVNEDIGRGKIIVLDDHNFILWPGQSVLIFAQNTWRVLPAAQRWILTQDTTFYVNPTSGSDSNDGLAVGGGEFLSIQHAYDTIQNMVDCNGWSVTIQLTDGEYNDQVIISGQLMGARTVLISGNTISPSQVFWQISDGQSCVTATNNGNVTVSGIAFSCSGLDGIGLEAYNSGNINFDNCRFGAFDGGYHMKSHHSGSIISTSDYTINGKAMAHIWVDSFGSFRIGGETITIPSIPSFDTAFLYNTTGYFSCDTTLTFTGPSVDQVTGQKYLCILNGVCDVKATIFPGTIAGATRLGGQVYVTN